MTDSVSNHLATAAAQCLLSDMAEAGLTVALRTQQHISGMATPEPVTIMFLGTDNDKQATELLLAISDKGLNTPKDFVHINLLKKDSQTLESTLATYTSKVIIVLGAENGMQLFPNHDSGETMPQGRLLQSSYSSTPVLITESLDSMLSNPDSKKSCWNDLQAAKEILNN